MAKLEAALGLEAWRLERGGDTEDSKQRGPLIAPTALRVTRDPRQIFVAYSYKLYPKADYRRIYKELTDAFAVKFVFADEKITSLHILQKIADYIRSSRFGIYDISGWNANVTLELGLAFGMGEQAFIAIDPTKTDVDEVPADLRGIDRIEYRSYAELGEKLEVLLGQEIPVPRTHEAENQLQLLREQTLEVVRDSEGLKIADIGRALGISTALAKVVTRPMVGRQLRTEGVKNGTKYFLT